MKMIKRFCVCLAAAMVGGVSAFEVAFEGRWLENGVAKTLAEAETTLSVYDAANGGACLYTGAGPVVRTDRNGYFSVAANIPDRALTNETFYVSLSRDGFTLAPRMKVAPAPYAIVADEAELVTVDSDMVITGTAEFQNLRVQGDVSVGSLWADGRNVVLTDPKIRNARVASFTDNDSTTAGASLQMFNAGSAAPYLGPDYGSFTGDTELRASTWRGLPASPDYHPTFLQTFTAETDGIYLICVKADAGDDIDAESYAKLAVLTASNVTLIHNYLPPVQANSCTRLLTIPCRAGDTFRVQGMVKDNFVRHISASGTTCAASVLSAKVKFVKFGLDK